jgi:long-chain acyl-CoA synthetase
MNVVDVLLGRGAPEAPALVGERRTVTYGELADVAARLGGELVGRGLESGDRIAIGSGNDTAFVAAYLATLHVGAIAVPLNPSAPPSELGRELSAVAPRLALAAGPAAPMLSAAGADVVTVDIDELDASRVARVDRGPDDVAVLLFTSGTAGAPKAAMLTHGNLASNIAQVQDHPGLRLASDDRSLGVLPFHHVFGLNVALGVTLAAGGAVVLEERFDAVESVARIRRESVTVIAGVPTMYASWLALDDAAAPSDAFASVRLAVSGAAPLPDEIAASFHRRFGVVVHQGYGLTEAAPIVTTTAVDDRDPRAGSIGPPLPGVEVRLVDADATDVLAGDPGEVWVRGPNVFPGYWHDQEATAHVLTDDGWLRTGDVAVVEGDELRLVDRAKDLIIVSGFNVYPVEVEDVLRADDAVRDVAVVGEPHPRTGETVVAYVVPEPGHTVDPEALRSVCARALARYKCPSRIEVVDELPRSIAGKLVRRELREPTRGEPELRGKG